MSRCSPFVVSFSRYCFNVRSAVILLMLGFAGGCASDNGPTAEQKQAAIQADPMGYKQDVDPRSLDGGVTNTNSLGKDLHDFFDP